jgi:putative acetyltransferase
MLIRRELTADREAVHAVHTAAFQRSAEARLVDDLRTDGDLALSFVAWRGTELIGHVCCSPARVGDDPRVALGLGPLGVLPAHQRTGAGSALVHSVLAAADVLGYGLIVLLGNPAYYSRFGFVLASTLAITPPDPAWAPHFQARTLTAYTAAQAGAFRYAPAFERLG